ncbi:MAG: hypothetical protein JKY86_00310 [Gammaproteobacteria bacterium]|nr:hypothetical protein [Gammaproteobacteria bacterium]MBL4882793.1 hypothetical protein [Oleispira sp.]
MNFESVVRNLNMEYRDEWCIVGSYAAWFHILRAKNKIVLSKSTWEKIVPGDIDIAISYDSVMEATVGGRGKYTINFPLIGSTENLGASKSIKEVEFVYNFKPSGLHLRALDQYYTGTRFASIQDCIDRLSSGSVKAAKNEARLIRCDILKKIKNWQGTKIVYAEPKTIAPSLFSQINAFNK